MRELFKPDRILSNILPEQKLKQGADYVLSQFVLPYETGGRVLLCNVLTHRIIELNEAAGEGYGMRFTGSEVGDSELLTTLVKWYFLVPEGKDECAFYEGISRMMRAYTRPKGVNSYVIMPTLGCNARCVYCYEEGMEQTSMTPETVEQTARFILETNSNKTIRINWFGGEPLAGEPAIDRICGILRGAGASYRSSMISNGSLITAETVRKMKDLWNVRDIQISMDGAEQDYCARKNYTFGGSCYRRVMNSVSAMSEAGIRVVIRCNVDADNWPGIPQFLDDLKGEVGHKDNVAVYFSPLNAIRASVDDVTMWSRIVAARPMVEAAGFKPADYLGFGSRFRISHCIADAGSAVVAPDGSLYLCEHCVPESRYGDVFRGVTDKAAMDAFARTDFTREKCRKCPFLPDCTSFSACPVEDFHCREVKEMLAKDMLKLLDEKSYNIGAPMGEARSAGLGECGAEDSHGSGFGDSLKDRFENAPGDGFDNGPEDGFGARAGSLC